MSTPKASIVTITRDRRSRILDNLPRLLSLPEEPEVIVVDDASTDGTVQAVRQRFPEVRVIPLSRSLGAAGRNVGVEHATAPYVAFADDDSWWEPGALEHATKVLDTHPEVGLVAARVVVEPDGVDDPTNRLMANSPLRRSDLPGPELLGFVACGAVVRRSAFLSVNGFHPRFEIGGEEELVALDLARAGWHSVYVEQVVAHHAPDGGDPRPGRRRRVVRNDLWTAWLRRPLPTAFRMTAQAAGRALEDPATRQGLLEAIRGLGWVQRERDPLPPSLEAARRQLDEAE